MKQSHPKLSSIQSIRSLTNTFLAKILHQTVFNHIPTETSIKFIFLTKTFLNFILVIQVLIGIDKQRNIEMKEIFCAKGMNSICLWTYKFLYYMGRTLLVIELITYAFLITIFVYLLVQIWAVIFKKKNNKSENCLQKFFMFITTRISLFLLSDGWKILLIFWCWAKWQNPVIPGLSTSSINLVKTHFEVFCILICGLLTILIGTLGFSPRNFNNSISQKLNGENRLIEDLRDISLPILANFICLDRKWFFVYLVFCCLNIVHMLKELTEHFWIQKLSMNKFHFCNFFVDQFFVVYVWLMYEFYGVSAINQPLQLIYLYIPLMYFISKLCLTIQLRNEQKIVLNLERFLNKTEKTNCTIQCFDTFEYIGTRPPSDYIYGERIKLDRVTFLFSSCVLNHFHNCKYVTCPCKIQTEKKNKNLMGNLETFRQILNVRFCDLIKETEGAQGEKKRNDMTVPMLEFLPDSLLPVISVNHIIENEVSFVQELRLRIALLGKKNVYKSKVNTNPQNDLFQNFNFDKILKNETQIKKLNRLIKNYIREFTILKQTLKIQPIKLLKIQLCMNEIKRTENKYMSTLKKTSPSSKIIAIDWKFRQYFKIGHLRDFGINCNVKNSELASLSNWRKTDLENSQHFEFIICTPSQMSVLKIINTSKEIEGLCGFSRIALIDQNPNMLIPKYFRELHEEAVKKYFVSGAGKKIGHQVEVSLVTKKPYLLPLKIYTQMAFDYVDNKLLIITRLQKSDVIKNEILCDENAEVIGATKCISKLAGLDLEIDHKIPVYLFMEGITKSLLSLLNKGLMLAIPNPEGSGSAVVLSFTTQNLNTLMMRKSSSLASYRRAMLLNTMEFQDIQTSNGTQRIIRINNLYESRMKNTPKAFHVNLKMQILQMFGIHLIQLIIQEDDEAIKASAILRRKGSPLYRMIMLKVLLSGWAKFKSYRKARTHVEKIFGLKKTEKDEKSYDLSEGSNLFETVKKITDDRKKNLKIEKKLEMLGGYIPDLSWKLGFMMIFYACLSLIVNLVFLETSYSSLINTNDIIFKSGEIEIINSILTYCSSLNLALLQSSSGPISNAVTYFMSKSGTNTTNLLANVSKNSNKFMQNDELSLNCLYRYSSILRTVKTNYYDLILKSLYMSQLVRPYSSKLNTNRNYVETILINFNNRIFIDTFQTEIRNLNQNIYVKLGLIIGIFLCFLFGFTWLFFAESRYYNFVYSAIIYLDWQKFSGKKWNQELTIFGEQFYDRVNKSQKMDRSNPIQQIHKVQKMPLFSVRFIVFMIVTFAAFSMVALICGLFYLGVYTQIQKVSDFNKATVTLQFSVLKHLNILLNPATSQIVATSDLTANINSFQSSFDNFGNMHMYNGVDLVSYFSNHFCDKLSTSNYVNCTSTFNGALNQSFYAVLGFLEIKNRSWRIKNLTGTPLIKMSLFYLFVSNYLQEIREKMILSQPNWKQSYLLKNKLAILAILAVQVFYFYFLYFGIWLHLKNGLMSCIRIFAFLETNSAFSDSGLRNFIEKIS